MLSLTGSLFVPNLLRKSWRGQLLWCGCGSRQMCFKMENKKWITFGIIKKIFYIPMLMTIVILTYSVAPHWGLQQVLYSRYFFHRKFLRTTIHCLTKYFCKLNFLRKRNSFIDTYQALRMLVTETFVKLYSNILIDVLVGGMQTSIRSLYIYICSSPLHLLDTHTHIIIPS